MEVGDGEKVRLRRGSTAAEQAPKTSEENSDDDSSEKIVLVIKSDTLGSGEAIEGSLAKIETFGVRIKILSKGLGNITEGDVERALASGAKIVGFNVRISPAAQDMARTGKVKIKLYDIIYELINDIKADIQEMVKPEIERVDLGKLKVLGIFRTEPKFQIAGGKVTSGQAEADALVEILRDGKFIDSGKLTSLQAAKQEVVIVSQGQECGFKIESRTPVAIDDELVFYKENKIFKKVK